MWLKFEESRQPTKRNRKGAHHHPISTMSAVGTRVGLVEGRSLTRKQKIYRIAPKNK